MIGGPFYRQILGGSSNLAPQWEMFHGRGLGTVEVTFEQELPDGRRRVIDRFATLGRAPTSFAERVLTSPRDLDNAAHALCDRLGPDARLYAHASVAVSSGWDLLDDGSHNLCAPAPR